MKQNRNRLAHLFSPGTRDLFSYVAWRFHENPTCWFFFSLWFLFALAAFLLLAINAISNIFAH